MFAIIARTKSLAASRIAAVVAAFAIFTTAVPSFAAPKCFTRKLGLQTVNLLWSDANDPFRVLRVQRPGKPDVSLGLNCNLASPVVCLLETSGTAQFVGQGEQLTMVMNGHLGWQQAHDDSGEQQLVVVPGKRSSLVFKVRDCKGIFAPAEDAVDYSDDDSWNGPGIPADEKK